MANIIVVDSDHDNISFIGGLLKKLGHRVEVLSGASELMLTLRTKQPELIVIGISLGDGDGRELSKTLQAEMLYRDIPVILTSPFYHSEREIKSFCCDELVAVPIDSSAMTACLQQLLAKEEARLLRIS